MVRTRDEKGVQLTELLYRNLVIPDQARIKQTGSLLPTASLRHRQTREALAFVRDFDYEGHERLFTEKFVKACLRKLLEAPYSLDLPCTPGFQKEAWTNEEGKRLHSLIKKARRSTAMAADAETQPWSCLEALDPDEADPCVRPTRSMHVYI
ncbi:unnamed protein product [Symbiodinium natans]|uniref:Uncharacterized protein n=1 Tax=Symbiodinium natans TaxID=878477 RepID=A0A812UFM4_9DINO|nr:unnamed protein product [Symbiodinium natans]